MAIKLRDISPEDMVRLRPFEGEPSQDAYVDHIYPNGTILVELLPEFREDAGDDGFREITVDQIEKILD